MSRLTDFIRHHLAGSGMLVALLLLCGFFSIVTWALLGVSIELIRKAVI